MNDFKIIYGTIIKLIVHFLDYFHFILGKRFIDSKILSSSSSPSMQWSIQFQSVRPILYVEAQETRVDNNINSLQQQSRTLVHTEPIMPKTMPNSNRSSTSSSSHNKQLQPSQLHATTTTTLMGTSVNATTTATTIHSNQSNHHSLHDECDVIGELMGKYGKYQFYMTFLLSLFQIPNTFHIASPVYQVRIPHIDSTSTYNN